MSLRSPLVALALLVAGLLALGAPVAGAEQPTSIVTADRTGGISGTLARTIGRCLSLKPNTRVIIENRYGAMVQFGASPVSKSPPNGRTLPLASRTTHAVAGDGSRSSSLIRRRLGGGNPVDAWSILPEWAAEQFGEGAVLAEIMTGAPAEGQVACP
jgi:hypothetical protein